MSALCGGVYEAKDVVEDVVRVVRWLELEGLGKAHGFLLSVHLMPVSMHPLWFANTLQTCNAPVTNTKILPSLGWAG